VKRSEVVGRKERPASLRLSELWMIYGLTVAAAGERFGPALLR
jgi:hypothetical protein